MNKVGVIGLGMLGSAVAEHLFDSGFQVSAYNRTKEKTTHLKNKGVKIFTSLKDVAIYSVEQIISN